jgi:phosphatidylserine decarboxylase
MDVLNIIAQTPPKFENKEIAGVPFIAFLYDLIHSDDGQLFFADGEVTECLRRIFDDYAAMLKAEESALHLNEQENGWLSPEAQKWIDYDEFLCDRTRPHYGFGSWNAWFTRAFKEGRRPVDPDPDVIANNCESYPLTSTVTPVFGVRERDSFWLKHAPYSLAEMFAAETQRGVLEAVRESFVGGTVYQGFLTPWCYHRWHAPLSGVVERAYVIQGTYFVFNPSLDKTFKDCYDNSQPMLSMVSTRQIFIIKADNPKIGRVGIIEIGMAEVAGCRSLVKEGDHV